MSENNLDLFIDEVARREPGAAISKAGGLSNQARFFEGTLLVGVVNLEKFDKNKTTFVACSSLILSPSVEVCFGVVVKQEIATLVQRLVRMLELAAAEEASNPKVRHYADRNNNSALYLYDDRKLFLKNKGGDADQEMEPSFHADFIYYAVFNRTGQRNSLVASSFIGELGKLVGHEYLRPIGIGSTQELTADMRQLPSSIQEKLIIDRIDAYGSKYDQGIVASLHHAMSFHPRKHFVILTGLSGSGKTSLALRYAAAVHNLPKAGTEDPLTYLCPVRPDWIDPSGLTGYRDVFTKRYVVPPFLQALFLANENPASPVFVILDEMNLARPEYYFSDVLSAMETGLHLHLHSESEVLPGDAGFDVPSDVPWPSNLFIIGTVNVDETTHQISPKVLDRAFVIDTTEIDLDTLFDRLSKESAALANSVEVCGPTLLALNATLLAAGLGFGYRTADEVVRYLAVVSPGGNGEQLRKTFDLVLGQKILIKLRGTERQRMMLERLGEILGGFERSTARIKQLLSDLNDGSFEAMR